MLFQSTLSMRRATPRCHLTVKFRDIFQSTLSMRRATTNILPVWGYEGISIHALHEESDLGSVPYCNTGTISIHALHEESDVSTMAGASLSSVFQSTLSMRRATNGGQLVAGHGFISIHALHEESDADDVDHRSDGLAFQSTLSMRRATVVAQRSTVQIHEARLFDFILAA